MNEFRLRGTGEVVSETELRIRAANITLPEVIDAAACTILAVDPVLPAPAPVVTATQSAVRNGVVQDALNNWVYAWTVRNWTQAEVDAANAAATEAARDAAIDATISSDATLNSLKAMDNAAFDAWWTANVTTQAQAANVLKRVVRVLVRRVL